MTQVTPSALAFTRQLLAAERDDSVSSPDAALRALKKLRVYLTKFVGAAGFRALMTRALALARAEVRWLDAVQVSPDGALDGFDEAARLQSPDSAAAGSKILLSQLFGLLVIFIGEAVTLRMVEDIWPQSPMDNVDSGSEETT